MTRSKVTVPDNRDFAMDTQRYSDAPLVLRRSFSRTKVKDERRIYPKGERSLNRRRLSLQS